MIINIIASCGEGKTKTALEIASHIDISNQKKTIYLTTDNDFSGWLPYVEEIVGKENINYFRPMFAKNLSCALQVLPYIDHLPYDVIILDGFSDEYASLSEKKRNELISTLESYTKNKNGKIIITIQQNNLR